MIASNNSLGAETPIFLVGFMGAGKTTVGRALAGLLEYQFLDLDELVEQRAGKTVQAIFVELGEPEFRRFERQALLSCSDMVRTVIALGGGAYVSEESRASLRRIGKAVWLDCPIEVCLERISGDRSRPLLGDEEDMRALLESRAAAYAQADFAVQSGYVSPEQLALEITKLLGRPTQ